MHFIEIIKSGWQDLRDHLFRTLLTMLGIVFGVAAVISMVSIGAGAEREAIEELQRFGTNSIRITARTIEGETLKNAITLSARGLSISDAKFLTDNFDFIDLAVVEKVFEADLYLLGKKPNANIIGIGNNFLEASRFTLSKGRFFTEQELSGSTMATILGNSVAKEIFGKNNPIGQVIQLGIHRLKVIGVMQSQGHGEGRLAIKTRDHDYDVYIPITTALEKFADPTPQDKDLFHQVTGLWITVKENTDIISARDIIARIIRRRHHDIDTIETLVPLEILQQSQQTQNLFNLVMAMIAGISLLVGGIGIMNIMLASVNERTREIGVRRAMGASENDIVVQFLTESTLISLLGGLAGIVVGMILSLIISAYTGWTTVIPLSSVLIAFFVSVTVGIVFGAFPAFKAARLDPVTALRCE